MFDPVPSIGAAIAYVVAIEDSWGVPHSPIVATRVSPDGFREVDTVHGSWGVWVQADGTLYGEC